jgi:phosphate transport system permease protein
MQRNEFDARGRNWSGSFFPLLTAAATFLILAILAVIVANVVYNGWHRLSWSFLTHGIENGMEGPSTGIFPMIFGTVALVLLMTIFVMPIGVVTAVYLTEFTKKHSMSSRVIHSAVNNLAGVPSIVFGLFGLGFFIHFVGGGIDQLFYGGQLRFGKGNLLWAAATMSVLTLPVVIVATEEALRAVPRSFRDGSMALGATKLETIRKIVLPQAAPGIITGAILALSRATGEVAPIMLTGAAFYMAGLPTRLDDQFMSVGYHIYILSTQSPDVERTKPLLYASVLVLLVLTFLLNLAAIFLRAHLRKKYRAAAV